MRITARQIATSDQRCALGQLHGLSPAEAALAKALAAGKSVQDDAEQAEATRETARWHLRQIFAKTDARRAAELVRLLLSSLFLPQPWL